MAAGNSRDTGLERSLLAASLQQIQSGSDAAAGSISSVSYCAVKEEAEEAARI